MAESPESLAHLVASLKAGDKDAYRELVHHIGEPLLRYAAGITGDHDTAHDVVQDAFIRIYRLRRKLDEQQEFRGLCFRIVRNLARNAVRDESLRRRREQEASEMRGGNDTRTQALAKAAWEQVAKLPGALREVLELRFAFGLNRNEIASALEIPEGTVATRQRKGIEQVRNQMSVGAPALAALLAAHQPSTPTPDLFYLEELVMNGIRSMKLKAAGMVASAAMVALLLLVGAGVTVNALVTDTAPPQNLVAHTDDTARSTTRNTPETTGTSSANTARDTSPLIEGQPGTQPDVAERPSPQTEPTHKPNPEPETPLGITPESTPELPEAEILKSAPRFESAPITRAFVGMEYVYVIEVQASPAALITVENPPLWLSLDGNLLRGTPAAANAGERVLVTLIANNGVAPDARQAFEIRVNAAPDITSTPDTEALAGKAYNYAITVKAHPDATLKLENAPAWLTLKGNVASGTPSRSDVGEIRDVKLIASNGVNPDDQQVWDIVVKSAPQFESQPVITVKAGELYEYKVDASGYPAPTVSASKLPDWLVLANGTLTGTPRLPDIGKTRKITLEAENGIKPVAAQSFTIEVEDNPGYVETPWTIDEVKNYLRKGLKVEWKHHEANTHMGKQIVKDAYNEVTAVNGDKITVDAMRQSVNSATARLEVKDIHSDLSLAIEWHTLCFMTPRLDRELATESIKAGGKTWKCRVYEQVVHGEKTYRFWFSVDHPGIMVRCATYNDAQSAAKDEPIAEQVLESLTVPKR